jgi:hypothetical protein
MIDFPISIKILTSHTELTRNLAKRHIAIAILEKKIVSLALINRGVLVSGPLLLHTAGGCCPLAAGGASSVVGGGELDLEQLVLGDDADGAVGARVRGAEQRVSLRHDVVAEHAVALVHLPGDQPRRARHAHAELAVVRHVQALVQRAGQDRLVPLHLHHAGLAAVLDRHLVRPRRRRQARASRPGGGGAGREAEARGAGRGGEAEQ